jgi:hypothetical protein
VPDTARAQRILRQSPTGSAAAGIGTLAPAAVVSCSGLLLGVRGRVIPGWEVSGALLVLALVVHWSLIRAARVRETARPARKRVTPRRLAEGLLIAAAVLGTAWGAGDDLISDAQYHVLSLTGPGGCRVVVPVAANIAADIATQVLAPDDRLKQSTSRYGRPSAPTPKPASSSPCRAWAPSWEPSSSSQPVT